MGEQLFFLLMPFWAVGFILLFVYSGIDTWRLVRFSGKIKRGFSVSKRPLSARERAYFDELEGHITQAHEMKNIPLRVKHAQFVKKRGGEVLVQSRKKRWSTSWPFVGYINLNEPEPVLQFRGSLAILFPLFWFFAGPLLLDWQVLFFPIIFFLFLFAIWYVSYRVEKHEIERFVRELIEENDS